MHQNYTLGLVKHINAQMHTFTKFSLRETSPDLKQNEAHERPCRTNKQKDSRTKDVTQTRFSSMLLCVQRDKDLQRPGSPGRPPRLSNTAPDLCVTKIQSQCCFKSTEAVRSIRDGEPRTAMSTFTQLLISD